MSDYTKQLQQIVEIIGRPGISPWVLAAFSSFLGVLGGFVGQLILTTYNNHRKLTTMRRLAYQDVGALAAVIDAFLRDPTNTESMGDQHQRFVRFKMVAPILSDDYMKANVDVYARLEERACLEPVYNASRQLFVNEGDFDGLLLTIVQVIAIQFKQGRLTLKAAARYIGTDGATTLETILARYEKKTDSLNAFKPNPPKPAA